MPLSAVRSPALPWRYRPPVAHLQLSRRLRDLEQDLVRLRDDRDARADALDAALAAAARSLLRVAAGEQRLDGILDSIADGIVTLFPDGTIETANRAAAHCLQQDRRGLKGTPLFAWLACPEAPEVVVAIRQRLAARAAIPDTMLEYDFSPTAAGASDDWLRLAISPCPVDPGGGGFVCILSNVTQRHQQVEQRLAFKRQRLHAAIENNQISTWDLNLECRELVIDDSLQRALGMASSIWPAVERYRLLRLLHPDDRRDVLQALVPLWHPGNASAVVTTRIRHHDGSYFWVRLSATTMARTAGGRPLRIFGTTIDISELVRAREAAERNLRSKEAFVACMTHELRTPLNAILGFAEMLELDANLGPPQRRNVGYILQATSHLINLANQTLDLARLESGHLTTQPVAIAVEPICLECLDLIRPAALARQITVEHHTTPGLQVLADPQRIRQILLNLLSNAVKYNYRGGRVALECGQDRQGQICLQVRDTGRGVRPEDLEALFEPFVRLENRAENGAAETIEGTGIGLAISRDLARLMAGHLDVSSTVGQGSTFRLTLPAPCGSSPAASGG